MGKYMLTKNEKLKINFFIIREVYHYMAEIDKIPNAMSRFYKYLELDENYYNKIIQTGICSSHKGGKMQVCVEKLIRCGFSDCLFRKDSPTLIKTSELLLDEIYEHLFNNGTLSLKDFRQNLSMYLSTIVNADDTLLVIATRKLLADIISASEPDDTVLDFVALLDDYQFEGHYLQKDVPKELLECYKQYKKFISQTQQ